MATNALEFGAQVEAWVRKTEARMNAVFRESTKRTVSLAQSRIPVDTGFARASVRASLTEMPQINQGSHGEKGKTYAYNEGEVVAVISGATIGGKIFVGWTANYVGILEAGHSKQAPSGFVRLAALQWDQTVREVTAELRSRIGNV